MLSCEYKKDFDRSYLILTDIGQGRGSYEEKILVKNDIKGFLNCQIRNINSQNKYFYDISSKQSMDSVFAVKEMEYSDMKNFFLMLKAAADEMKKYLLDGAEIVLEPMYIYMEIESETIWFLYYPGYQSNMQEGMQGLAEFLLNKINHKDSRAVDFAYWLYDYVQKEQFSILKIIEYFEGENREKDVSNYKKQQTEVHGKKEECNTIKETETEFTEPDLKEKRCVRKNLLRYIVLYILFPILLEAVSALLIFSFFAMEFKETAILFGFYSLIIAGGCILAYGKYLKAQETTAIAAADSEHDQYAAAEESYEEKPEAADSYGETTYLGSNEIQRQNLLIGKIKGKDVQIQIDTFPFIIGKMKGHVNYVLPDMSISRMHAKLFQKEDMVYLTDLNSTNGTYKNGVPLEVNEEVLLAPGDEIQIGSLLFTYH